MSENSNAPDANGIGNLLKNASPETLKLRNESTITHNLKRAAWRWLYAVANCRAIGMEVRLEGPLGRIVDVVGIGPDNAAYIVEVKSTRADMRRDDHNEADRRRLMSEYSTLRDAESLTARILSDARRYAIDTVENDSDWCEDPAYRQASREHSEVQRRVNAHERRLATFSTKFHDPAFMACADYHYLMTPAGLLSPSEIPSLWGLINGECETVLEAVPKQVRRNTLHVMRAIAKANTRDFKKLMQCENE